MKTVAIVLVAGNSKRFECDTSKQLFLLAGKPVFAYSLTTFNNSSSIDEVCVVANENCINEINEYVSKNKLEKVHTVLGGKERQDSVRNGLEFYKNLSDNDLVIIHDGARPLIDEEIINSTIEAVKKYDAVTTFIKTEDTICVADGTNSILEFIDRRKLMRVQTPQAFKYHLIRDAHKYAHTDCATDDCSLVMALPHTVKLIPGSKKLTKLTTLEDANYLETFIK